MVSMLLVSCGIDSHHFRLEGHLLKMNFGEFYVYSPDGITEHIDTIKVQGGRFAYQIPCETEGILVIVMPNFSEIPIFAQPGKTVTLKADAQNMKEMEVKGTDANEAMSEWRKDTDGKIPPLVANEAEKFIRANPSSVVSNWLLRKYFITSTTPNLKKASELADFMVANGKPLKDISLLAKQLKSYSRKGGTERLPAFSTTDIDSVAVKSSDYMKGLTVITTIAKWNYDGQTLNRMLREELRKRKEEGKPSFNVLTVSLDPSVSELRQQLHYDPLTWHVICDGKMWESPIVKTLGITSVPYNIVVKDGRIIARRLKRDDLIKMLDK